MRHSLLLNRSTSRFLSVTPGTRQVANRYHYLTSWRLTNQPYQFSHICFRSFTNFEIEDLMEVAVETIALLVTPRCVLQRNVVLWQLISPLLMTSFPPRNTANNILVSFVVNIRTEKTMAMRCSSTRN